MAKEFSNNPKWRNFSKSGHTVPVQIMVLPCHLTTYTSLLEIDSLCTCLKQSFQQQELGIISIMQCLNSFKKLSFFNDQNSDKILISVFSSQRTNPEQIVLFFMWWAETSRRNILSFLRIRMDLFFFFFGAVHVSKNKETHFWEWQN